VTLENGTVVTPDMVSEKPALASSFAAVFLPNKHFVGSFLSESNLALFDLLTETPTSSLNLVYHSTSFQTLLNDVFKRDFLYRLRPSVQHVFDTTRVNLESEPIPKSRYHTMSLQAICPPLHPMHPFPDFSQETMEARKTLEEVFKAEEKSLNFRYANFGTQFDLYPR
jgi:hypothetical protein